MHPRTRYTLISVVLATLAGLVIALLLTALTSGVARAVMIEPADRTVERIEVRYVEPIPAPGKETRAYFELNDGSAWGYRGYGPCARANKVPNRICKTVFWYAR